MPDPADGLEALDQGGVAGPAPEVPGAAAPVQAAPPVAPAELLEPVATRTKAKRPSGAAFRRRRAAAAGGRPAAPPAPPPPAAAPEPEPEAKPAAEVDAEGLRMAREVIEDPDTLDFIEGLYRMPFELWANAVKVPAVVPSKPRLERAAALIRKAMTLFGPKAWMKYLPLVFLVVAIGEDVVLGVRAIHDAREERGGSRRAGSPGAHPPSAEGRPVPPNPGDSGPLPAGDPA